MARTSVYIDGFNLYFGIKEAFGGKYLWLDLARLAQSILKPQDTLVDVKYFTATVRYPDDKRQRQRTYLDALAARGGLLTYLGRYQQNHTTCRSCGSSWRSDEEKLTDVQIAVQLVSDAFENKFDKALLIGADGDLVPPIDKIRTSFPQKRVVVFFPPKRRSPILEKAAHHTLLIYESSLGRCLLPDPVTGPGGLSFARPASWS